MTKKEKLNEVLHFLKETFVAKDEIIDLLGIGLIANENAFLLGPPGTAKSAIVRLLSSCVDNGKNFEYLLTRFTEPNEIFGPFDIRKLKDGELATNTEGMLPEASMIFLDEIFNANSAILNSLLTALNEKIFRRGREIKKIPALMFVGASNLVPEDEALNALLDRFLIRVRCDYVDPDSLHEVLLAGRKLNAGNPTINPTIGADEIHLLQQEAKNIDLTEIREDYVKLIHGLRNSGIKISDRRAVKIQNLISASALICGRTEAISSDLWVLKHIWDTEEQIEVLAGAIEKFLDNEDNELSHPQASPNSSPNAEKLAEEVAKLTTTLSQENVSFEEKNLVKDRLRFIQNRASWIGHNEHKEKLSQDIESLWQKILNQE